MADISDSIVRSVYIRHLSEQLNIDELSIVEKISSVVKQSHEVLKDGRYQKTNEKLSGKNGDLNFDKESAKLEKRIISMMLQYPSILPKIQDRHVLDFFENARLKSIGEKIITNASSNENDVRKMMNIFEDPDTRQLIASLTIEDDQWENEGCIRLITQFVNSRKRRQDLLLSQIKAAEENNDQELLYKLLKEKQRQAKTL